MSAIKRRVEGLCFVCAAIMKMKNGPLKGKVFTDEDWNDEATVNEGPYEYSKVSQRQSQRATQTMSTVLKPDSEHLY